MPEILRMPEVAANTPEAVIAGWNVGLDDAFTAGTALVTVETEKAVVDVEAETDGVVLRLLVEPGAAVAVGDPIAVLGVAGEDATQVEALLASLGVSASDAGLPPEVDAPAALAAPSDLAALPGNGSVAAVPGQRVFSSPLARRLAKEHGLDLASLNGSGPGGRVRRRDVDAAVAALRVAPVVQPTPMSPTPPPAPVAAPMSVPAPAAPPAAPPAATAATPVASGEFEDVPLTRARQAIARRLTESKQSAPHFYLRGSARVDRLLALREELNAAGSRKVSVNDLVVKAVAKAHQAVPEMNVTWNGDSIRRYSGVDVAVAVATEGGLVTPVVRGVESMGLGQVSDVARDLAVRARERRLQQNELEGGTITVSNLGMFGTEEFAAIINPPQAAILAVGAARPEAVVVDGAVVVAQVVRFTLSVDHRPVDGADAARWMAVFVALVENPLQILV